MSTAQLIKKWTLAFHPESRQSPRGAGLVKILPANEVSTELSRLQALGYCVAVNQLHGRRLEFRATDERTGEHHVAFADNASLDAQQSAVASLTEKIAIELEG